MASSGNSKPSQRVTGTQLNESLLSANNLSLDVSEISDLSANFGNSLVNESFMQAVFSQGERVSTPKCLSKPCESDDGDGLSDANISQEESVSTPKGQRKRKCVSKNLSYLESGEDDGLSYEDSYQDSDDDQSFVPPAESTPVSKRGRTQSLSPIKQRGGRKQGSTNKHQQFGKGVRSTSRGHGIKKPKRKNNKENSVNKGKISEVVNFVDDLENTKSKNNKENSVNKGEISEVVNFVDDLENTGANIHTMEDIRKSLKSTTSPVKRVRHDEPNFGVNRSKMREARPHIWQKNVRKAARNSGKEYTYQSKKTKKDTIKRARNVREPCTCKRKCYDLVGRDNIQAMHDNFWKIGNYNMEQLHLYKLLDCNEVKSDDSVQNIRFGYNVNVNYKAIPVCKEAFLNIFDIHASRVNNLKKKIQPDGSLQGDMRGQQGTHNAIDPKLIDAVHDHIQSLNVCSSHYDIDGKVGSKQYIVPHIDYDSMNKVYTRYIEYCASKNIEHVKAYKYFEIFNKHYNISIMSPKIDICGTCEKLKQDIAIAKRNNDHDLEVKLQQKLDTHENSAKLAYLTMSQMKDKNYWKPEEWLCICIDLQQTHMLPKTNWNANWYKRKCSMYNFCIADLQQNEEPYFYLWEEFNGGKGSAEIFTAIDMYLREYVYCNPERTQKKLRIVADNAGGQNKNQHLLMALLRMVHLGYFSRIELIYLVPGHSYMAPDRKFGNVANAKKKRAYILSPDDLEAVVKGARVFERSTKRGRKSKTQAKETYKTHRIRYNDVLHVETLTQTNIDTRHVLMRKTKEKEFQKAAIIMVKDSEPNGYFLKNDFQMCDDKAKFMDCRTPEMKKENQTLNLGNVELGQKYKHQLLMKQKKLDHINEQVTGALKEVRGGKDLHPDEINWAQELIREQEKIRKLTGEAVQNKETERQVREQEKIRKLTGEAVQNEETERQVLEEGAEEISDDMYAYTREDFKFTSVKRKDVAIIETANVSEYDTDDPDNILSENDEEK